MSNVAGLEPDELAALMLWIDTYSDSRETLKDATGEEMLALWATFRGWYDVDAVNAIAAQAAILSTTSQQTAAGASLEYVAGIAAVTGAASASGSALRAAAPAAALQIIRNATPLSLVYTRPSEVYKRAIATGATIERATELALARAQTLVITDLTLQERAAELDMLVRLGLTDYRRIIHPELSRSGTCGLCIAASDRVYHTGELMPIHDDCKCTVMPIVGDHDPGRDINGQSIADLYKRAALASDGLDAAALKNVRAEVVQHGEYGAILVNSRNAFRGPDQVRLEDDPARAERMLRKVAPTLAAMEADPATDPVVLADVRARYDRLVAIVPPDFDTAT